MQVVDRTDGKLVHLDGINFSRAWCLYNIANRLVAIDAPAAGRLLKIGDNHVRSGSRQIVSSQDISWHDNGIQDIHRLNVSFKLTRSDLMDFNYNLNRLNQNVSVIISYYPPSPPPHKLYLAVSPPPIIFSISRLRLWIGRTLHLH